jgi:hypothetical protein
MEKWYPKRMGGTLGAKYTNHNPVSTLKGEGDTEAHQCEERVMDE